MVKKGKRLRVKWHPQFSDILVCSDKTVYIKRVEQPYPHWIEGQFNPLNSLHYILHRGRRLCVESLVRDCFAANRKQH